MVAGLQSPAGVVVVVEAVVFHQSLKQELTLPQEESQQCFGSTGLGDLDLDEGDLSGVGQVHLPQ